MFLIVNLRAAPGMSICNRRAGRKSNRQQTVFRAIAFRVRERDRQQNVPSTIEQKSTPARTDGTRNILPSQILFH